MLGKYAAYINMWKNTNELSIIWMGWLIWDEE